MYQENNNTISWLKIVVKILLVFLVVILLLKIVSMFINKNENNKQESTMSNNLTQMMEVAKDYFNEETLPKEVGKSNKVDLNTLIKEKKIDKIKDQDGKECNGTESFIKATKLDKEYQLKAYLVCGEETDYLNDFIPLNDLITIKPSSTTTTTSKKTTAKKTTSKKTTKKKTTTSKTTTTSKKTTSKVTTTKKPTTSTTVKKYSVSFNTNGGGEVIKKTVKENRKVTAPTDPVRPGYKFVGWYYHGVKFDFNTKITQDYILVAKWTK